MKKEVKMSSLEVVKVINDYRKMEGKSNELAHKSFMAKIRKELESLESSQFDIDDFFTHSKYKDRQKREKPCFELSKKGVKYLMDLEKSSDKMALQSIYANLSGKEEPIFCINRFESSFFTKLKQTLNAMEIEIELEKNIKIKNKNYRIDGYLPKYNLAIEYDEKQHKVEPQKSKDIQKEKDIKKEINCSFIRLDYKNHDCFNIGLVVNCIINKEIQK